MTCITSPYSQMPANEESVRLAPPERPTGVQIKVSIERLVGAASLLCSLASRSDRAELELLAGYILEQVAALEQHLSRCSPVPPA